ncbi:MAG: hypothetical protein MUP09_03415 [Thiovulaceae bacterium]|nr:hypothetical protein [Sulfurimonadaceae bacterium]
MDEPRLQEMSGYKSLSGEKRRIVWAVILAGLIMGTIYLAARSYFMPDDAIETQETIVNVPAVK